MFEVLKRRKEPQEPPVEGPDPRADALRRKLEEARSIVEEREEFERAETSVDTVEAVPESPERRRRDVHAAGREAAARMREQR